MTRRLRTSPGAYDLRGPYSTRLGQANWRARDLDVVEPDGAGARLVPEVHPAVGARSAEIARDRADRDAVEPELGAPADALVQVELGAVPLAREDLAVGGVEVEPLQRLVEEVPLEPVGERVVRDHPAPDAQRIL